jgi:hypothetical protein
MESRPLRGARALQIGAAYRYDIYDTSNIIEQYRDIVLHLTGEQSSISWGAKAYG